MRITPSLPTANTLRRAGALKFRFGPAPHRVELLGIGEAMGMAPVPDDIPMVCWTLFITGPKVRTWGFHCPEQGWIRWDKFTAAGDAGAVGRGCDA